VSAKNIALKLALDGASDTATFVQAGIDSQEAKIGTLKAALINIAAQETRTANATVKRMANMAREAARAA